MEKRKKLGRGIEDFSQLFLSSEDDDKNPQDVEIDIERPTVPKRSIAVVTRGGSTNLFLVFNLAIELNREGLKVAVMDTDGRDPHVNLFQSAIPSSIYLCRDNLSEDKQDNGCGIKHVLIDVDLTSMDYLWEDEKKHIYTKLKKIEREADIILIYVNISFLHCIHSIFQHIREVIVSTPSYPIGMLEAYSVIKKVFLMNPNAHLGLVVNEKDRDADGQKIFDKMQTVVKKHLHKPIYHLGSIFKDKAVEESIRARKPLSIMQPDSQSVKSVKEVAKNISLTHIGGRSLGLLHGRERGLSEIFQVHAYDDIASQKI